MISKICLRRKTIGIFFPNNLHIQRNIRNPLRQSRACERDIKRICLFTSKNPVAFIIERHAGVCNGNRFRKSLILHADNRPCNDVIFCHFCITIGQGIMRLLRIGRAEHRKSSSECAEMRYFTAPERLAFCIVLSKILLFNYRYSIEYQRIHRIGNTITVIIDGRGSSGCIHYFNNFPVRRCIPHSILSVVPPEGNG